MCVRERESLPAPAGCVIAVYSSFLIEVLLVSLLDAIFQNTPIPTSSLHFSA